VSKQSLIDTYDCSEYLDAKWGVMRRFGVSETAFEDWVIDRLHPSPAAVVLDVGAGSGRFTLPIARRLRGSGRIEAVDLSRGVMATLMEAAARESLPIQVTVADIEDRPFPKRRYDLIVAGHMLYHLRQPVPTLERLREALAPGGQFVATTNARDGMPEFYALYCETLGLLEVPVPRPEPDATEFTSENGAALLGQVFDDVRAEQYDGGFLAPQGVAVLTYFASTQLYRGLMRDDTVPIEVRARIAPTYAALAQRAVDAAGGQLRISKPMTAFFCRA